MFQLKVLEPVVPCNGFFELRAQFGNIEHAVPYFEEVIAFHFILVQPERRVEGIIGGEYAEVRMQHNERLADGLYDGLSVFHGFFQVFITQLQLFIDGNELFISGLQLFL